MRPGVAIAALDLLLMPLVLHITAMATKSKGDGALGPVLGAVAIHAVIAIVCTIVVISVAVAQHLRRNTGLMWIPVQITVMCGAALISYSLLLAWPV